MSRLVWGQPADRVYQTGVDRGVLYPTDKPAVAWNGLFNVVEQGQQSSTTYRRDGLAYLTVVSPREFAAQISAYTFPDEFAEICGIVEAADGLFLDAQIPDSFNLSYRTMYDDGTNYKIHLVYGATATLADVQYQTLSDASNLSTFEFDISTVPQKITGYRPTAHLIIDTRQLAEETVDNLENLIYGTHNVEPSLPAPDTLVEMLGYGDKVVVVDHGDGTWTATGSYKNVKTDEFGNFTINNVPRLDLASGEYEFASTGETLGGSTTNTITEPMTDNF